MNDMGLRREMFAWFGAAAYAAQCFEVELVVLLLLLQRLEHSSMTPEQLDDIDTKLSSQNLGRLLGQLKKYLILHPKFERLLNHYREKRNYLTHQFFYQNASKLSSREGCYSLIADLKEIESAMREADRVAQVMSRNVRKALGMPEEEIDKLVAQALSESR